MLRPKNVKPMSEAEKTALDEYRALEKQIAEVRNKRRIPYHNFQVLRSQGRMEEAEAEWAKVEEVDAQCSALGEQLEKTVYHQHLIRHCPVEQILAERENAR